MTRMGLRRALSTLVALAAGCGALPSPRACSANGDCPSGALCTGGVCVADRPPEADIAVPSPLVSNLPLTFSGSGSTDPDAGDHVASWAWTFAPVGGACDPQPAASAAEEPSVVFPCAGSFDVGLVVADTLGVKSAPKVARVAVDPSTDPPQVTAGADVALEHRCTGTPPSCTPWDGQGASVALSASATGPEGVTFSYHWVAQVPAGLASQPPRVSFLPGPDVASPSVLVETDGTAIAGGYTFTVEATDSRGMVAVARQRVTVGNRPPVVAGGGTFGVAHAFQPATGTFVATGTTPPLAVSDPDGDPVTSLGFAFAHAGDGSASYVGQDLGDRATVTVTVAYRTPSDAALLIGPTVHRRADLTVVDANGASATAGFEVVVENRPPRLAAAVPAAAVDHAYDAAARRYLAVAPLSSYVDDDGDPLSPSVSGDPLCAAISETLGTTFVTCALPYAGVPAVSSFAGTHAFTVSMADPWAAGPAQATALEIRNRPPRLAATQASLPASCTATSACCELEGSRCNLHDMTWGTGSATLTVAVDDDGDPLDLSLAATPSCLTAAAGPQPCPTSGCPVELSLCALPSACLTAYPSGTLSVAASDGLDFVQGSLAVESVCR